MTSIPSLLMLLALASGAASANETEAGKAASFATHLADKGDHYRAIGEFERALWLAPTSPEAGRWMFLIGEAYRLGEQYETAGEHLQAVAAEYPDLRARALLAAAQAWQGARRYESAIERAREAAAVFGEGSSGARKARYVEGWSLLLSTERGSDERDAEAAHAFRLARGDGAVGEGADKLFSALPRLDDLPHRSPFVAGALGLVPGFGHFYLGDLPTGLSALVWNGLFGWAVYEAIRAKNYSLAAVLGVFELMWYGGSITGAVSGAHRFNQDARLNAMDELKSLSPPALVDEFKTTAFP